MLADLVSAEDLFPGLQKATFSWCVYLVGRESKPTALVYSSSFKDTRDIGLGPTFKTSITSLKALFPKAV